MLTPGSQGETKIVGTSKIGEQRGSMQRRTVTRLASHWAIVLVTLAAWILLSNHCALGLSESAKADSGAGGCPMHSGPAKGKPAASIPCCKDLRAVASHAVRNLGAVASQLAGVQHYLAAILVATPRLAAQIRALETGPPRSLSFAESILQRSILAHAPPANYPRL